MVIGAPVISDMICSCVDSCVYSTSVGNPSFGVIRPSCTGISKLLLCRYIPSSVMASLLRVCFALNFSVTNRSS